jgi:hypothetical protein
MLRLPNCAALLVVLLAACATSGPSVPAGIACEAKVFTVTDSFDGARRGRCAVLADDHVRLSIRPEDKDVANPSAWYAFRLIPRTAGTANITLEYVDGYHRYRPKTSTDGLHWSVVDESLVSRASDGQSATVRIPLFGEPVWVSAQELVLPTMYDVWNRKIAAQSDAGLALLGKSKSGQAIPLLTVNENASEVLLLVGRQHPPEVSGAFALFAFYETLVADNELAKRFRDRYQVLAVPLLNPDGVVGGNWRHNLGNTDLNRDWGPFEQPETRLIRDLLDRLDAEGRHVRVFLDFHSTAENVFYTQDDDNATIPAQFARTWLDNARARVPETYPYTNRENPTGAVGVAKNYVYHRYGIPALTYEVGDETDRTAVREAAVIFAEELMRLMLLQTYE